MSRSVLLENGWRNRNGDTFDALVTCSIDEQGGVWVEIERINIAHGSELIIITHDNWKAMTDMVGSAIIDWARKREAENG